MIAITIISSMSVNPNSRRDSRSPLRIRCSIAALIRSFSYKHRTHFGRPSSMRLGRPACFAYPTRRCPSSDLSECAAGNVFCSVRRLTRAGPAPALRPPESAAFSDSRNVSFSIWILPWSTRSLYLSIAARISRRSLRSSLSCSRLICDRATGTAIVGKNQQNRERHDQLHQGEAGFRDVARRLVAAVSALLPTLALWADAPRSSNRPSCHNHHYFQFTDAALPAAADSAL